MCGIFILLDSRLVHVHQLDRISKLICNRGPDFISPLIDHSHGCRQLKLRASVLHLRGDVMQEQPVIDNDSNLLMYNGQIYTYEGNTLNHSQSDTEFLMQKLKDCKTPDEVATVFTKIEGPFAFIYLHKISSTLIYGRDMFGRKSLCSLNHRNPALLPVILASVTDQNLETIDLKWSEVSCTGLHCIDLSDPDHPNMYTFNWNLDQIYPKTSKCHAAHSLNKTISAIYLSPLNQDLRKADEFDQQVVEKAVDELEIKFMQAVERRFRFNKKTCLTCRQFKTTSCHHSKVAVAFSGGLDSTLIALALDKILIKGESIDLITVSFKPDSPDRTSVCSAFKELMQINPDRNWRLVLCDISVEELQRFRDEAIRNLILPCDSVFDDGIGCACWFVGRGEGRAIDTATSAGWLDEQFEAIISYDSLDKRNGECGAYHYTSPASMLFVGSSIDEQLGGYSSHRSAWSRRGSEGILEEVSFLMRRLSSRNLGRDDRVYCDHGRDLKLPFLDFELVSYLNQLPIGLKMNLDESLEIGPKKILRLLALRWGLNKAGRRVKRAMQFGTRIANLENNKEKGNEICCRLRTGGDSTPSVMMVPNAGNESPVNKNETMN